jgi:hypothetical protein
MSAPVKHLGIVVAVDGSLARIGRRRLLGGP